MNPHFEKLIKGELATFSFNDLCEYCDSLEGKYVTECEEEQYRKGYWDGVHEAVRLLKKGAEHRQIDEWLWNELKKWRYRHNGFNQDGIELPPKIVPWAKLRKAILISYAYKCAYCGKLASHVDHIIPVSREGQYSLDNLVASCKDCNIAKGTSTLDEMGMEIKFYPVKKVTIVSGYDWVDVKVEATQ